jgi:glutamate/aspartate transport system substrate-binding protein
MGSYHALWPIAFVVCALASPALADELSGRLKKIKDSGTITIGNRESSVPFSYLDKDNKPVGYSMDLCNYAVEKIKQNVDRPELRVRYMTVAPAARIPLLSNGTIDMECSTTSITLSRMRQVGFSSPTFAVGARILTKSSSGVKDWEDLPQKIVGVAQGTGGEKKVRALAETAPFKGLRVLTLKDHAAGMLALETDRVDAYVTDDIILYGLRSKSRLKEQLVVTGRPLSFETFAIVLPRDDPDFRLAVDSALAELYASPEIKMIYQR